MTTRHRDKHYSDKSHSGYGSDFAPSYYIKHRRVKSDLDKKGDTLEQAAMKRWLDMRAVCMYFKAPSRKCCHSSKAQKIARSSLS